MYMDYGKLWKLLLDKNMTKGDLLALTGISSRVLAKLARNETVTTDTLTRICAALGCDVGDIMACVGEESLSLCAAYRRLGTPTFESEECRAVAFLYRGHRYTVYTSRKAANRATHIHCRRDGGVYWEQLYPFGGMSAPSREEWLLVKPERDKEGTVIVLIKGRPASLNGLDDHGFCSAERAARPGDILVMTEASFKVFSPRGEL